MDPCMNLNMRKANRVLNSIYDRHLQSCGLKGGQFSMLKIISSRKKTTNSELQDVMLIDQTTLSRNLKPLIRDGYIEVTQGEDLRMKILSLSSEGEELYLRANKCWQNAQKEVKKRLGAESAEQVIEISRLVASLKT